MSTAHTFEDWLKQQSGRDGPTGEFARAAARPGNAPKRGAVYEDWINHLGRMPHGYEAFDAFKQAWDEYAIETRHLIRIQVLSENAEFGQYVDVEVYACSETMARAVAKSLRLAYPSSEVVAAYFNNPLRRLSVD